MRAIAGLLAYSPGEQEPSPELRSRVMDAVRAEAELRRAERPSILARIADYLSLRSFALGAAVLLVVGLLVWNVVLRQDVQEAGGPGSVTDLLNAADRREAACRQATA